MIVITGSEGNIGRRLCAAFRPVIRVDRAGAPDIRTDLATGDLGAVAEALADAEALIHLATSADPSAPPDVHLDGLLATARIVRLAAGAGVRRLVLASSDWAAPKDPALRPGAYGHAKRAIEEMAALYSELPGRRAVALRIGWVPGDPAEVETAEDWLKANFWDDQRLIAEVRAALSA